MTRVGASTSHEQLRAPIKPAWLMSLKTRYCERIFSGDKRYEFRRVRMQAKVGDVVLVYESYPTKRVAGHFTVGPLSRIGIAVAEALELEHAGEARDDLARYLDGAPTVTALQITGLVRYEGGRDLGEMTGHASGPMSYCRLTGIVIDEGASASR